MTHALIMLTTLLSPGRLFARDCNLPSNSLRTVQTAIKKDPNANEPACFIHASIHASPAVGREGHSPHSTFPRHFMHDPPPLRLQDEDLLVAPPPTANRLPSGEKATLLTQPSRLTSCTTPHPSVSRMRTFLSTVFVRSWFVPIFVCPLAQPPFHMLLCVVCIVASFPSYVRMFVRAICRACLLFSFFFIYVFVFLCVLMF